MKPSEAENLRPGTFVVATCWNGVYGDELHPWIGKVEKTWRVSSRRTQVSVRDCAGKLFRIWNPDIRLANDEERALFAIGTHEYNMKVEQDERISRVLGVEVMVGANYGTISLTPEEALAIVERLERCECDGGAK